jgi:hypothetical protein
MSLDFNEFQPVDPEVLHVGSDLARHRVRGGESLESLAGECGCTWQDLAVLNFGTEDPDEVNWYLENYVGCTKKAGALYGFCDSDEPGIIRLPKRLEPTPKRARCGVIYVRRFPLE